MKIVLTGAPGVGKTTVLEALRKQYPTFHYVPEVATQLLKARPIPQTKEEEGLFSVAVEHSQWRVEAKLPPDRVCILDRGRYDPRAFRSDPRGWRMAGWQEDYDAVFVLTLPPAERWGGNNPYRYHSYDEAVVLQQRLINIYKGAVPIGGSIEDKIDAVSSLLKWIVK